MPRNRWSTAVFVLMLACAACLVTTPCFAAGVHPLAIDVFANPGDMVDFELFLTPGEKPERVNLSLYRLVQQLNGELDYEPAEPADCPQGNWVSMPMQVEVLPGHDTKVSGTVRVPFDAVGSNTIIIMVEPEHEKKDAEISFRVRYAVRLTIRVDRPGLRPSAEIVEFCVVKDEKGEPVIQARVRNTSALDYLTSCEVTIRDHRRRLLERVELKPASYRSAGILESRLYPFSEVLYTGKPLDALLPGTYELRLFFRYASRLQLVKAKNVTIKDCDYVFPASKLKSIKVTPMDLEFTGRPGEVSSKGLRLENRGKETVTIVLEPADIEPCYAYSIFSNAEFEVRGGPCITIPPGRTVNVVTRVRFPKDSKVQGNYGLLRVKAYSTNKEFVEESVVNLSATVLGSHVCSAKILSVSMERDGDDHEISMVIENTGNVKTHVTACAVLRDANSAIAGNVRLGIDKMQSASVLPSRFATLTGTVKGLKPGAYKAEVRVYEGSRLLGFEILDVELKR